MINISHRLIPDRTIGRRKRDRMAALEAKVRQTAPANAQTAANPALPSHSTSVENNVRLGDQVSPIELGPITQPQDLLNIPLTQSDMDFSTIWCPTVDPGSVVNFPITTPGFGSEAFNLDGTFNIESPLDVIDQSPYERACSTPGMDVTRQFSFKTSSTRSSSHSGSAGSDFADDYAFDIPLMKCMTAGLELANMLGCLESIFDPTAFGTLAPVSNPAVPAWLQPTTVQQTIPHHPFIDILPWPSVRTKLILALAQPAHLRPPAARDTNPMITLMADTDDIVDGCRVNGDGFNADDWEVGQAFFSNWWWALDPKIVNSTNQKRVQRGASRLQLSAS
jgi:hypothetical protein